MQRALLLLTLVIAANGFCEDGLSRPIFADDGGQPSVDVIQAQAPLYSDHQDPRFGELAELFGAYHTSIMLQQGEVFYTLGFAITDGNLAHAIAPNVVQNNDSTQVELKWNQSDARYCLSSGIRNGREHWSQLWSVATTLTTAQVDQLFDQFVLPLNSTQPLERPQYQLLRVDEVSLFPCPFHQRKGSSCRRRITVEDLTCGDGARWVINYAANNLGAKLRRGFKFRQSQTIVRPSGGVQAIEPGSPEWPNLVSYFSFLHHALLDPSLAGESKDALASTDPLVGPSPQILDMIGRYVYDGNTGIYYKSLGKITHTIFYGKVKLGPPSCNAVHNVPCKTASVANSASPMRMGLIVASAASCCVAAVLGCLLWKRRRSIPRQAEAAGVSLVAA